MKDALFALIILIVLTVTAYSIGLGDRHETYVQGYRAGLERLDTSKIVQGPIDCKSDLSNANIIAYFPPAYPEAIVRIEGNGIALSYSTIIGCDSSVGFWLDVPK